MPAKVTVQPRYGLMYAYFSGHLKAQEAVDAFEGYLQHPDFAHGQKHLVNFSDVTSFEGDFTNLMLLQARLVDAVMPNEQILFVYCAPTSLSQEMAQYSSIAWKNVKKVVLRILKTEAEAMDVVGLPGMTFAELANTKV